MQFVVNLSWNFEIKGIFLHFNFCIFDLLYNDHNRKDLPMCTFDYEVQRKVFQNNPMTREEAIKRLSRSGVVDENGNLTPKYSFIAKYGRKATV